MTASGEARLLVAIESGTVSLATQAHPGAALGPLHRHDCADFETLWDAISHHLWRERLRVPAACALCVAAPVQGDHIRPPRTGWAFSAKALRSALGLRRLLVLQDVTALGHVLPQLGPQDCRPLGGGHPQQHAPIVLLRPGAGLQFAGLVPSRGELLPIDGGAAHLSLASADAEEAAVLQVLQRRFGRVSAELALSHDGLQNLYEALAELRGEATPTARSGQIAAAARKGDLGLAGAAVQLFCSLLGSLAGNLALTLGARGGAYLGGGFLAPWGDILAASRFRERFEAGGRFSAYLGAIPSRLLLHSDHATLLGAALALDATSPGRADANAR